ncbi:hypothetical protein G6F59_014008 [Rhizopus arrhizus]|nr:hypothetical protein G6F59_014008 [Rhizopus arrhizus]
MDDVVARAGGAIAQQAVQRFRIRLDCQANGVAGGFQLGFQRLCQAGAVLRIAVRQNQPVCRCIGGIRAGQSCQGLHTVQPGGEQIGAAGKRCRKFKRAVAQESKRLELFLPETDGLLRGELFAALAGLPPILPASKDEVAPGSGVGTADQQYAVRPQAGTRMAQGRACAFQGVELAVEDCQVAQGAAQLGRLR